MKKSAKDHVTDLGKTGEMSQKGSDGLGPKERMEKYCGIDSLWSETLLFGGYKPKEIVEYMLVSDGDPARGLRKNIFNPKLQFMGVAVGPHPDGGSVTVVDFVSKELAHGEAPSVEVESIDEIPEEVQKQIDAAGLKGKVFLQKSGKSVISTRTEEMTSDGIKSTKNTNIVSKNSNLTCFRHDLNQKQLVNFKDQQRLCLQLRRRNHQFMKIEQKMIH